jgi:hypothetical protein
MKSHPRVGWVRSNAIADESAKEILQLKNEIDSLKTDLSAYQEPAGTENLSKGEELVIVDLIARKSGEANRPVNASWNEIFQALAAKLLSGATEDVFRLMLIKFLETKWNLPHGDLELSETVISRIIIQFRALDLIEQSETPGTWKLTPRGERQLLKVAAIQKGQTYLRG